MKKLRLLVPHLVAIVIFFAVNATFFAPQFSGKTLFQSDIAKFQAASKEAIDYQRTNGKALLWTNAMFGGMPTYQISRVDRNPVIIKGQHLLSLFMSRPIGYFLAMMISYYLLLVAMGVNPWLSIIGSIAYSFATYNMALFQAGHTNKLRSFIALPLVTAGLLYLLEKRKYLLGSAFFTFGLALNLNANHIQMTYYFFLCALILGVIYLVKLIQERHFDHLVKVTGIVLLGTAFSIGPSVADIWSSYEYMDETIRGKPILETAAVTNAKSNSSVEGVAYEYAMEFSQAGRDLWTLLAPRAMGGSNSEMVKSGALHQELRSEGYVADEGGFLPINNLYWGGLPFTSGPAYFGVVILFLFVLGAVLMKGPLKWWIVSAIVLILLLSLGKNLDGLQRLFFDYFPLYSKWRSPNSIISIAGLFFPLLAVFVLNDLLKGKYDQAQSLRALYIATGVTGGLALIMAIIGTSFFSFALPREINLSAEKLQLFITDRQRFFRADFLRSAGLILLAASLLWAFLRGHLKSRTLLMVGIGILVVGDLYTVARRYIRLSDFVTPRAVEQPFVPRAADEDILSKETNRGAYRVFDLSVKDPVESIFPAYYHNLIGGYSAAKLQRMQDIIDYYVSKNNRAVLNMFNAKYIIDQKGEAILNPRALGNAWLVEEVKIVTTPEEEIQALNEIDPGTTAVILDQEFNNYIGNFDPQRNGDIQLSNYDPQNMVYQFASNSEQLAVFSEVWYNPEKGWKAYIDDQEVPFVRANYILRALRIPAGRHEIRFEFAPKSVIIGGKITRVTGWLVLFFFILVGSWSLYQYLDRTTLTEGKPAGPLVNRKDKKAVKTSTKRSGNQQKSGNGKRSRNRKK